MSTTFRSDIFNAYPRNPMATVGKELRTTRFSKTVTSGTSAAGDVFILGGPYTMGDRISGIIGANVALTSATSCDLGFWVVAQDGVTFTPYSTAASTALWSAVTLAAAITYQDLLSNLNAALDRTKNIGQLLSLAPDKDVPNGLYLGLRFNNANTAASVVIDWKIEVEQATTN